MSFTREQCLQRLRAQVAAGRPILGGGAGVGLSAKCAEAGGVGPPHHLQFGSLSHGRPRQPQRHDALRRRQPDRHGHGPRGAAGGARHAQCWPASAARTRSAIMPNFLRDVRAAGFSGVQNFPTVGLIDGTFRQGLEETGMGFDREVEMIAAAHDLGLLDLSLRFHRGRGAGDGPRRRRRADPAHGPDDEGEHRREDGPDAGRGGRSACRPCTTRPRRSTPTCWCCATAAPSRSRPTRLTSSSGRAASSASSERRASSGCRPRRPSRRACGNSSRFRSGNNSAALFAPAAICDLNFPRMPRPIVLSGSARALSEQSNHLEALAALAHVEGGWGYAAGQPAHLEPTCLALLALSAEAPRFRPVLEAGKAWLAQCACRRRDLPPGARPARGGLADGAGAVRAGVLGLRRRGSRSHRRRAAGPARPAGRGDRRRRNQRHRSETDRLAVGGEQLLLGRADRLGVPGLAAAPVRASIPACGRGRSCCSTAPSKRAASTTATAASSASSLEAIPGPTAVMLLALQGQADDPRVTAAVEFLRRAGRRRRGPRTPLLGAAGPRRLCGPRRRRARACRGWTRRIRAAHADRAETPWLRPAPLRQALTALALDAGRDNPFRLAGARIVAAAA